MISYRIDWTPLATSHLGAIHEFVLQDSVAAAERQVDLVLLAADRLLDFPEKGRPGRRRKTRELIVSGTPYIIAYRLHESTIEILAVIHGARRWPRHFTAK